MSEDNDPMLWFIALAIVIAVVASIAGGAYLYAKDRNETIEVEGAITKIVKHTKAEDSWGTQFDVTYTAILNGEEHDLAYGLADHIKVGESIIYAVKKHGGDIVGFERSEDVEGVSP